MPRDRIDVDRRIGRAADRRAGDDRVLEGLAGQDVRRLEVLVHDLDGAAAGLVGDLGALPVGRRDRGAARQRHAERFGERIHGRGGAHGVAVADRRRRRRDDVDELVVVDAAGGLLLARLPHDGARADALAVAPAVEHRAAGEHDRRNVHRRRRHQAGRGGLVAAGGEHDAVDRIAEQQLDEPEIGEIAVERRRRPLAGLLDRMHRKLEGDAAGVADAVAHAVCELEVMPVARRKIGAGLGDGDDRLVRGELFLGQPVIEVALEVEGGHPGIVRIVEPQPRAQAGLGVSGVGHGGVFSSMGLGARPAEG